MRLLSILPLLVLFTVPLRAGEQTKITGFDPSAIDRSANPCTDFYQFACGGWLARTEIPSDQSAWGRFNELAERNRMTLRDILQTAGAAKKRTKIGDFYAACMDEEKIESLGTAPLKPELKIIDSIKTNADVGPAVTKLYASGVHPLFEFYANQDYKNAVMMIAEIDQYGLGLPDRDYYLNDDAKSVELRAKYEAHIARMFALLGYDRTEAQAAAKTVLSFETQLAKASQDKVFRREPANTYHKMTTAELAALAPAFDWNKFFAGSGAPKIASLNVVAPDFLKRVSEMAQKTPVDDWKTYLRWQLLLSRSQALPAAFVNENFDFYGKTLTGAAEIKPRWKRCVAMTDAALGEDLGRRYVELTFGAQGKSRMQEMIKNIEAALRKDIGSLDWMTEATRKQAIEKLDGIANKIGYPDKWRDYSKLKISRGDALGNMKRSRQFELKRSLDKIGTPVDRGEWEMTPPTVNAYYNPQKNDINFPAGILQPPFFDNAMDDAVNYGAIGAVIAHELTHGFDDSGRNFDAQGNLRDWWTPEDAAEFNSRAQCFVDEYSQFVATDDVKLNGKLTLGENTADNGGVRVAYMALRDVLSAKPEKGADGFTPQQRFFLGWGQIWCGKFKPETLRLRALTDPHSPSKYRINGVMVNMPEFEQAFACKKGQAMTGENRCRVW